MSFSSGARLGPYEIISALGRGGMGEVYSARDSRLNRIVALKVVRDASALDPEARERFEREARAVASERGGREPRWRANGEELITQAATIC